MLTINGRHHLAHRLAWEESNGPIPEGLFVCHHCDNPPCCNPSHLFLGTQAENLSDMSKKGRRSLGERISIISEDDARTIISLRGTRVTQREIAARFGVSRENISAIWRGKSWKHLHRT